MFKDLKNQLDRVLSDCSLEDVIRENNILEQGLYITVKKDVNNSYYFDFDSIYIANGKDVDYESEKYSYYSQLDLYSKYLSSNKSVGDKNISSCNYLSLFLKKDTFDKLKGKDMLDEDATKEDVLVAEKNKNNLKTKICLYYDSFKEYSKKDSKKYKIYKEFESKENYVANPSEIESIKMWMMDNILSLNDYVKLLSKNSYIKIFIDKDVDSYRKEYLRYALPSLFLDNKYNRVFDGVTYGVPIPNISLNNKKPYKMNLTRYCEVPYLTQAKTNQDIYNTFRYFKTQSKNPFLYLKDNGVHTEIRNDEVNGSGIYLSMVKKTDLVDVMEYDIITSTPKYRSYLLSRYVEHKEDDNRYGIEYYIGNYKTYNIDNVTNHRERLSVLIDNTFFNGKLSKIYFAESSDIDKILGNIDSNTKRLIKKYKNIMFNCLIKGSLDSFEDIFDKMSLEFIRYSYDKSLFRAIKQFNVRMSIMADLKGVDYMRSGEKSLILFSKIEKNEPIETNEEFSYALGQIIYYMFTQCGLRNNYYKQTLGKSANADRLIQLIIKFSKKYEYKLKINPRFKELLKLILEYKVEVSSELLEEHFMLGYVSTNENVLYMKKDSKKDLTQEVIMNE